MAYELKIEIYRIQEDKFASPLAEAPEDLSIHHNKNDVILIIGKDVWVKDYNNEEPDTYRKAIYSPEFIKINPWLFEKQK